MNAELCFFVSMFFGFVTWGVVTDSLILPELRRRTREEALRPLLMFHSFRFVGLAFLVPGVVSADLPAAFAEGAAYGDIIAAMIEGEATVKTFKRSGNHVWLMPHNPAYTPIPGDEAEILGRVVAVLRRV